MIGGAFDTLEVGRSHFHMAATFVDNPRVELLASDALHLAVAASHGLMVLTMDQDMAAAGRLLSVPTRLV